MAKTLDKIVKQLPGARRAKIEARAAALIAKEMTLRDMRRAREMTQDRLAELLGIGQDSVSRLEQRTDLLLSTLQSFVRALGGSLRLVVEFPDRPPVALNGLAKNREEKQAVAKNKSVRAGKNGSSH